MSAILVGFAVAALMTIRDWALNPAGIFHGADGTDWGVVAETAVSWFVPVGGVTAMLSLVGHLIWWRARPPAES